MVIFIGDKPSARMAKNAKPFEGAACEKRLKEWMSVIFSDYKTEYTIINQCDYKPYFPDSFNFHVVIALGNNASIALDKSCIRHFKLPHPSGKNFQLNNKKFVAKKLKECKNYIKQNS